MKKVFFVLLFFNLFITVFGQRDVEFSFAGIDKDCKVSGVVVDKNDNFLTTGIYRSNAGKDSVGNFNINHNNIMLLRKTLYNSGGFVAKFTQRKELQWLITIENASNEDHHLLTDDSSNVYFIGKIQGKIVFDEKNILNAPTGDIFVAKYSSDGKLKWAKKYVGSSDDGAFKPKIDSQGNLYIVGKYQNSLEVGGKQVLKATGVNPEPYILKLDRNGNYIWAKSFNENLGLKAATVNDKSEVFIIGDFKDSVTINGNILQSAGSQDIFFAKYDKNGQFLWVKTIAGKREDISHAIETDKLGNVYLTGLISDNVKFDIFDVATKITNGKTAFLAKISDNDGKIGWIKNIAYPINIDAFSSTAVQLLKLNADGEPYIFGTVVNSLSIDSKEIIKIVGLFRYIVKFNTDGTFISAISKVENSGNVLTYITAMEIDSKRNIYEIGRTSFIGINQSYGFLRTNFELYQSSCNNKAIRIVEDKIVRNNLRLSDEILNNNNFNYQWYKNGQLIANATQATFQANEPGYYSLKLISKTNSSCEISSLNSIGIYPAFSFNPFSADFSYNQNGLFISGLGDRFEWYRNNEKIAGLTGNRYVTPTDGTYQVKTYNNNGVQVSNEINIQQGKAVYITKRTVYDNQGFRGPTPLLIPIWLNTDLLINAPNNRFQWFLNGQLIKDSTYAHFKPITPGEYQMSIFVASENRTYISGKYKIIIEDFPKSLAISKIEDVCGANALLKVDDYFMQQYTFQSIVWRLDDKDIPNENYPYLNVNKGGFYTFSVKYFDGRNGATCQYNSFVNFEKKNDFKLNLGYAYAGSGCIVDSFKVFTEQNPKYSYSWTKNDVPIEKQATNEIFIKDKARYKGIVKRNDGCVNETDEISLKGCTSDDDEKFLLLNPPKITADKTSFFNDEKALLSFEGCSNVNLQWLKNDQLIVGANQKTLEVRETGNYTLEIERLGCKAATNALKISVETILAVGEEIPNFNIEVYPNPTEEKLFVSIPPQINTPITLKMTDVSGKLISNYDFSLSNSQFIDLKSFQTGVYFLVFEMQGKRVVKRIVKNN